jgi:beta-galactosidase/beta-glucuronidase
LKAELWNSEKQQIIPNRNFAIEITGGETQVELNYDMGSDVRLWSEFEPSLYRLTVTLNSDGKVIDSRQINFGMRELKTKGTQFTNQWNHYIPPRQT